VCSVQHGISWLDVFEVDYDVIHVQWPEALFGFQEPSVSELRELDDSLDKWKEKGAKLVATVHNNYPHGKDNKIFRELYGLIYEKSDGLIHLGNASRRAVRRRHADEVENTQEAVIPHGRYSYFPNNTTRKEARAALSLPTKKPVMLAFGELRRSKEVCLLREGFMEAYQGEERLVIACRLPHRSLRDWKHFVVRLPLWLNPQVELEESYIPAEEVQLYFNAADVLILPRIDSLNSGNVALGWTFGTVVVGPAEGVIGEMLKNQGCPTFKTPTAESLARAVREGLQSAREGQGKRLMKHAKKRLSWDKISRQHIKFYKEI
jgi:glycosyltransferase involved in cell wall biosynthesis